MSGVRSSRRYFVVVAAFSVTTSRSVFALPGTKAAAHPPQVQRKRAGPSVSAPGWRATPVIKYWRRHSGQRPSRSKGVTGGYSPPPSAPLRRRNAGTSRSNRLPPDAAFALGVLR